MKFCVPLAFILGLAFCIDLSTSEESILGVARDRLTQFRAQIAAKLKSALGNQHETLSDFVTDFKGNFNRKLSDVRHCYEARFANQELNIFNNSMSFKSIAQNFYEKFSNKTITRKSLRQLRSSIREIIRHCLKNRRTTVRFGFTEFSDWSDKEMKRMMGFVPSNFTETQNNSQLNRRKRSNSQCVIDERAPLPARFDWREADKVTPVKFQRRCGSCWAFAANAAIESAWLIKRGYKASKTNPDLSEQHLVNCAYVEFGDPQNRGCSGANADIAFNYHLKRGYAVEKIVPYTGYDDQCDHSQAKFKFLLDYCIRGIYRYRNRNEVSELLSDETIMRALVQKGPTTFNLNGDRIRNYRGGVYDRESCSKNANHLVLLVGYDSTDNSWIIKNSWGHWWGENGYMKVVRGKNMCGVNTEITWPLIRKQ